MAKLDKFIEKHDLEGTAVNSYGESVYLGKPTDFRHTKNAYNIKWDVPEKAKHNSPFDRLILHSGKNIFGILNMRPFRLDNYTKVQVTVK